MTDLTNDTSQMSRPSKRSQPSRAEYNFYFSLILIMALPTCAVLWAFSVIRHRRLPEKGPIQSAFSEAHVITPQIFGA